MGLSKKIKDVISKYLNSKDVWVIVVAEIIAATLLGLVAFLYVLIKTIFYKVPIREVLDGIVNFLSGTSRINNAVSVIDGLIIFGFAISIITNVIKSRKEKSLNVGDEDEKEKELPTLNQHSTVFFWNRIANAFPGQRGLQWYDPKTAVRRLKVVFKEPLLFQTSNNFDSIPDPIWWFRGGSALHIHEFKTLSSTKILLNREEIEIKRIAVNIDDLYYKCFIYIEAKAEKQTGLCPFTKEDIQRHIESFGYSNEEYGLFGKAIITREQYDDGATIIKGNVVDTHGAELRVRYLSDYNFIVSAKQSPYNSGKFEIESKSQFNSILQGKETTESFFQWMGRLPKHEGLVR